MDVYVVGTALHPPSLRAEGKRLEEMVFDVTRAALDDAGVRREEIDQVTIAACDELDGRSISSMLLAIPAGAYLKDEIKCTDSGLVGLCLGAMRMASGSFDLGVVASWNKTSKAPLDELTWMRCEPFYTRPVGLNRAISDGLFAAAVAHRHHIRPEEATAAAVAYGKRAARNPRALGRLAPATATVAASPFVAAPLRQGQRAGLTDGAAALVLASGRCLARRPDLRPLARVAGLGWCVDSYDLGEERLAGMASFRAAFARALEQAGTNAEGLDACELDSQTGYHAAAFERALPGLSPGARSPSGGPFAQNPYFCTGLVHAVEAVLQVSGRAGDVQVPGARLAAAHGTHGFALQGNAVIVLERPE